MRHVRPGVEHTRATPGARGFRLVPDRRGQSLTEFALVLPLMLMLVLFGIDFGRVFLGWIELNNVAREAANYAAENPTAWNTVNPDTAAQAEYARLVTADATRINCTLPGTIPAPSFPNGVDGQNGIATPVKVSLTCTFGLITPIVSQVLGASIPVSASAAFPIRSGFIPDIPLPTPTPTPSPTPEPTPAPTPTPTPAPTPTPNPSATPTPTPAPTAAPTPSPSPTPQMCIVPNLTGVSIKFAADIWGTKGHGSTPGAGFLTALVFSPLTSANSNGTVSNGQTLLAGRSLPCATTAMTVPWN
jgi:cell division septation protein DedD